jgi:hypothetical protein
MLPVPFSSPSSSLELLRLMPWVRVLVGLAALPWL